MGGEIICSICFEEYQSEKTTSVVSTNCGHIFHEVCLKSWKQRSATCPECRTNCLEMKIIFPTFKEAAHKDTALSTQLECNLKILSETQANLLQSQRKIMDLCEKLENLQLVVDSEVKENAILRRNIESLKEHAISEDVKLNFEKELESFTAKSNAGIRELCYQFMKKNHEKLYQLEDPCQNNSVKDKDSTPGKKKKKKKDQNIVVFEPIYWPSLGDDS